MRNIKFRAWSRKFNKFMAKDFHLIGETTLFDLLNQHRLEELETLEITECTGIKDRKGIEIYEGDIIKYDYLGYDKIGPGVVSYIAGIFVCDWKDQTDTPVGYMMIDNMEIIGNTFENADLLKKI